jgi:hypothetical protein
LTIAAPILPAETPILLHDLLVRRRVRIPNRNCREPAFAGAWQGIGQGLEIGQARCYIGFCSN